MLRCGCCLRTLHQYKPASPAQPPAVLVWRQTSSTIHAAEQLVCLPQHPAIPRVALELHAVYHAEARKIEERQAVRGQCYVVWRCGEVTA